MKAIFTFLFISICSITFSQNQASKEVKITKENLSKAVSLKEIFVTIPSDCDVIFSEYSFSVNGKVSQRQSTGNNIYVDIKLKHPDEKISSFTGVIKIE